MLHRFGINLSAVFPTLRTSTMKVSQANCKPCWGRGDQRLYLSFLQQLLFSKTVPAVSPLPIFVPVDTRSCGGRKEQNVGYRQCRHSHISSCRLILAGRVGKATCRHCLSPVSPPDRVQFHWHNVVHATFFKWPDQGLYSVDISAFQNTEYPAFQNAKTHRRLVLFVIYCAACETPSISCNSFLRMQKNSCVISAIATDALPEIDSSLAGYDRDTGGANG
jgi:hypothetical protein